MGASVSPSHRPASTAPTTGSKSIRIPVRVPPSLRIAVRNSSDERPAATHARRASRIGSGSSDRNGVNRSSVCPMTRAIAAAPTTETDEDHQRRRVRRHGPVPVPAHRHEDDLARGGAQAQHDAERVEREPGRRVDAPEEHERDADRCERERNHARRRDPLTPERHVDDDDARRVRVEQHQGEGDRDQAEGREDRGVERQAHQRREGERRPAASGQAPHGGRRRCRHRAAARSACRGTRPPAGPARP